MPLKAVRIVDPFILRLVERVSEHRKDSNPTKTAARMIHERFMQMEGDIGSVTPALRRPRAKQPATA